MTIKFSDNEAVEIWKLEPQGHSRLKTLGNGASHLFDEGVWGFKAKQPFSIIGVEGSASVLTAVGEDPWPKPPPPPPSTFADPNVYNAKLTDFDVFLINKSAPPADR